MKKNHHLWWQSSYDRGLSIILELWPRIKEKYPDATISIAYGWDLFDKAFTDNKERQEWKKHVQELMKQDGVIHHGRIGQSKLKELRKECGILAYPTWFDEIFMIGAVESQNDGLVPVTMNLGALPETAQKGVLVDGDINDKQVQEKYLEELLSLMGDDDRWKKMSHKCQKFARKFSWDNMSKKWDFTPTKYEDKISIYTPTIRNGFFNIMASNIASQTHKNIEWIIVDGQDKSREDIANKYAKEYDLDIKYIHQGKTNRTYGLANANNLAINKATGYLFVFLQDFVLLPPTALEELLRVSKQHPGDFIAPVDNYFSPKIKPNVDNKEDWFDGSLDIIGKFMRKNIRIQNQGIRKSETITDFEQNYGAVPLSTLKALNGYWEFYDEALGWDDTEIIYRAKALGYNLWVDDTNQCICIDHWSTLGKDEGGTSVNRTRRMNDPRYVWMVDQMNKGKIPTVRDPEIEKKIDLQYDIPESVSDEDCVKWVRSNLDNIIKPWGDL